MGVTRNQRKSRQRKNDGKKFLECDGLVYVSDLNKYITREECLTHWVDTAKMTEEQKTEEEQPSEEEEEEPQ